MPKTLRERFVPGIRGAHLEPPGRVGAACRFKGRFRGRDDVVLLAVDVDCRGGEGPGWLDSYKKGKVWDKYFVKVEGPGRAAYTLNDGNLRWVPRIANCEIRLDVTTGDRSNTLKLAEAIEANLKPATIGISYLKGCPRAERAGASAHATAVSTTAAKPVQPPSSAKPRVELTTSMGKITLELDAKKAPRTVSNFLEYVHAGHYDGTIFHRAIRDVLIQGGGFDKDRNERPTRARIGNEADNGLGNTRGSIAMARALPPHSAGSQFFINVADNRSFDHREKSNEGWGYCVFGKVVAGMKVVDATSAVATGRNGLFISIPRTQDVVIEKARVVR